MYRASLQLWSNSHNQVYKIKKYGYTKLQFSIKFDQMHTLVNHNKNKFGTGVKLLNQSSVRYSSDVQSGKSKSRIGIIAFSTITLGTIGILTLAKNNPDVREILEKWIPGTDHTIKVIFQEDQSYVDHILDSLSNLKESIMVTIFGTEEKDNGIKPVETPQPKREKTVAEPKIETKSPVISAPDTVKSTRIETKTSETTIAKSDPVAPKTVQLKPTNVTELEIRCRQIAEEAINSYNNAIKVVRDHNAHVVKILEENAPSLNLSSSIWEKLKGAVDQKKTAINETERTAMEAFGSLKNLSKLLDDFHDDSSTPSSKNSQENIKKALFDVDEAKRKYEKERGSVKMTEQFWNKVKRARENFNEELEILFPNVNVQDRHLPVNSEILDLFILYMYNKVNYLHTELEKLETIGNEKLRAALSGYAQNEDKLNELISREVQKEKRQLQSEFEKTLLAEKKIFEEVLRKQLKLQSEVCADQIKETLDLKERETQRFIEHTLGERLEKESNKYKAQLSVIVGRLRGLDEALKIRLNKEKGTSEAQLLWAACQALARALEVVPNNLVSDQTRRPLEAEIKSVSKVAPKDDILVKTTLAAIPKEAIERGVYPEVALRARFLKVEHEARRLALVPEEGGSLPMYLFSYIQNFMIIKSTHSIPSKELADEPIDTSKLDTYDILNRARYWIDRGDFKMTLKYMNLLKGASRSIARDWMNETRILLETRQAVDILIAYTGAISLLFLSPEEKQKMPN